MPVIKSAKKKLKQDKKRQVQNKKLKDGLKVILKKVRLAPTEALIKTATSATDKAAKKNIIHKNKAAHIKSSLSKLLSKKDSSSIQKASPKKAAPQKKKASSKSKK